MRPLLIAAAGRALNVSGLERREGDLELLRVNALPPAGSRGANRPVVVVLDRCLLRSVGADRGALAEVAAVAALVGMGDPGEVVPPPDFPTELVTSYVAADAPPSLLLTQLRGGFRHAVALLGERTARGDEAARQGELAELSRVGAALTTERNLFTLLELILTQARRITTSDAGSIYLVDQETRREDGTPVTLRFKLAQNATLPDLPLHEFTVPADDGSLAGHAAATGEPLVIEDVYLLPEDVTYRQNRTFDESFGYRTKSMLVIPMKTHKDEVVGVLQLINRKCQADVQLVTDDVVDREVRPYDGRCVALVTALAAQAAVAIENSLLYQSIEQLFDGFVTAAVHAIEQRDPATFGHSERVAALSVGLAEAVSRAGAGSYRGLHFSASELRELRYAGLLHDFGKVGVREKVLVKRKKLYQGQLDVIRHRFAYLLQQADLEFERERANYLEENAGRMHEQTLLRLEEARRGRREELNRFLDAILRANEPTVLPSGTFDELQAIGSFQFVDVDGARRPLLHEDELRFLMVQRGNLDEEERKEIESHVTHTFAFLRQIPWTRELRRVPEIAYAHHEKLNGAGYPRRVRGNDIPVQARMMTIADIFDALTATDRPYKRAVPIERALDILHAEAREGMLDRELLATFTEARIWDVIDVPIAGVRVPSLPMASGIAAVVR